MALLFPLAFRLDHASDGDVQDVALHPSYRLLASALDGGGLLLHVYDSVEAASGSLQLWLGHSLRPFVGAAQPGCTAVCFVSGSGSAAGGSAVAGSAMGALVAADVETGRQAWADAGSGSGGGGGHASRIKAAAALGPHLLVTGDSRGVLKLWDLRRPRATATLEVPGGGITDICWVAGQDALLAASSSGLEGGLSTISLRSPQLLSSWEHHAPVHAVAALHSGRSVVCGDERGRWGLGRWGQLRGGGVAFRTGHGSEAVSALVQCDSTGIVSASRDGSLRACRIEEGPPVEVSSRAPVQAHAGGSRVRLAISGSGAFIASAAVGESTVQLWHTHLLFAQQASSAQGVASPLPKLTLRRDTAATAAAEAAAEAAAAERQQKSQQPGGQQQEEGLCIICMTDVATGGFAHAGTMHSGFCVECIRAEKARRPGKCPVCRERVDAYIERMF
ncbi:hypothetical protein ABPG75_012155 [Micractinium tetrahymenae]